MTSAKMAKWCVIVSLIGFVLIVTVYLFFFNKPPPDVIMAQNKQKSRRSLESSQKALIDKDVSKMSAVEFAQAKWDAWIEVNQHIAIGEVYDSCDKKKQLMVGRVIMIKDPVTGGLISRTISNITYDHDITTGEMLLQVWYNGRVFYKNHWELCHMEDDLKESERIIFCPIKAGKHKYINDFPIPNYLPKGRYQTKYWAYDQNYKDIGCTFSDFTL